LQPVADTTRFGSPKSYTPQHLAERILTSRAALEGERKQVIVLFADIKGSMELLADRDAEAAHTLLFPPELPPSVQRECIPTLLMARGWSPNSTPRPIQPASAANSRAAFDFRGTG
jgi:hypothetical protein